MAQLHRVSWIEGTGNGRFSDHWQIFLTSSIVMVVQTVTIVVENRKTATRRAHRGWMK